jgi:formylglycine-generating enzyme required for sulfatase activity
VAGWLSTRTVFFSAAAVALASTAVVLVVRTASHERLDPTRCPAGAVALGPRCCAEGQYLKDSSCVGRPQRCPTSLEPFEGDLEGCVPPERRIEFRGGTLDVRPVDWEAEGVGARREARVAPFAIDATEMTMHRWQPCVASGACRSLAAKDPHTALEPGRPITGVTPEEAMRACRFYGGRLPSGDEWVFAAAGVEARRFPWGPTGLVCRRAVFGLVAGPCARGAVGPEIAGTRPDGATPEGVLDLVGNVAEWTVETDGSFVARGGSYASRVAADVKSWSVERPRGAAPTIGFRCAYDVAE